MYPIVLWASSSSNSMTWLLAKFSYTGVVASSWRCSCCSRTI